MAPRFLSDEWMTALAETANGHDGFKTAVANVDMSLEFHVTDVPDGDDVTYHMVISGGSVDVAGGPLEGADVTITNNYDTASAISKGELNTQMAFMTGKLKVQGNMAKLMMNQAALTQFSQAVGDMDIEYAG